MSYLGCALCWTLIGVGWVGYVAEDYTLALVGFIAGPIVMGITVLCCWIEDNL
jgi:hypothetical protein